MNLDIDGICWLLWRIRECVRETEERKLRNNIGWGSSRRYIFMGCYDVWYSGEDTSIYFKIMVERLTQARDLGLIISETGADLWRKDENWHLTAAGEEFYQKNKTWD